MKIQEINRLLKADILSFAQNEGTHETPVDGLQIHRIHSPAKPKCLLYNPLATIIVQGSKTAIIGGDEITYSANQCLAAGIELPGASYIIEASNKKPYLSVSLQLDRQLISQLVSEMPPVEDDFTGLAKGIVVADVDADLLSAFQRLVELLNSGKQTQFIAPLIVREIHYRLLTGPLGRHIREFYTHGTQSNQITRAISWIKNNFTRPLEVSELAKYVNMAPTTFHRHFRKVTSISPLQYQKTLRLHEAQRLMIAEDKTAYNAAYAVGYESPTQFSREYKRLFGEPPRKSVSVQTKAS